MADNAAITISMQANEALLAQSVSRGISKGLSNVTKGGGLDSRGLESAFGRMTTGAKQFETALDRANQRTILFGASASVLYNAAKALENIASATIDVEKNMVALNSIFRLTDQQLGQFQKTMFNIGQETSQSFDKVAEAAQELARQGLSVGETAKRTRDAMILTRLAAIDTATAVNTLTAAINGFQKEGLDSATVVNKLANVDAAFAVSAKDLSEALVRVGSAAQDSNVSFNQLIALVTSAKQITGRDGAVISQALNTIFTRVNRKDTQEALEGLGVQMRDLATNKALPTLQVLSNFSKVYDQLTGSTRSWAAELVGGVRNLNTLKAVLSDLSKENSVYGQVLDTLGDKTNAAYRRNQELNQSLEATYTRFKESNVQILSNIGNVGFAAPVKTVLNTASNNLLGDALKDANGQAETTGGKVAEGFIKGFGNAVIFGLGPVLFKALGSLLSQTIGNITQLVTAKAGLNQEQEAQAAIEQRINTLYKSGNEALLTQLATTKSLTAQAEILAAAFARADATAIAGQSARGALARTVYESGYRPRAAGGYLPAAAAESAAIRGGVGGAPASARPVTLQGFNFGGGVSGPLVANSSEFIVPNMAGGGSAIYNRDMIRSSGLPPGAIPVAAGGYVPNAAGGSLRSSAEIALGRAANDPVSAYQAAIRRLAASEKEAETAVAAATDAFAKRFGTSAKLITTNANEAIAAYGSVIKQGPFLPQDRQKLIEQVYGAKIVTDQSRRASPQETAAYEAARAARQAGSSGLATSLTPLYKEQGLLEEAVAQQAVATRAPLKERISRYLKSPGGQIGTSLGLTFAGGAIGEGEGGTYGGIARGGLGSGLTYAGTALSLTGNPIVAGAAGTIGLLIGSLSKLNKSTEELAQENDEYKKKLTQGADAGANVLRLQAEIVQAVKDGETERALALRKEQATALQAVPSNLRSLVQNNLNNPNGLQDYYGVVNPQTRTQAAGRDVLSSLLENRSSGTKALGDLFRDASNRGASNDSISRGIGAFVSTLENIPTDKLKELGKILEANPQEALRQVGAIGGVSDNKDFQKLLLNVSTQRYKQDYQDSPETELVRYGLSRALGNISGNRGTVKDQEGQIKEQIDTQERLRKLAADYERAAQNTQIAAGGEQRITQLQQQLYLGQNPLNARELALQEGQFGRDNIYAQSSAERSALLSTGQKQLVDIVKSSGATSPIFSQAIGQLNNPEAVQSFIDTLNTDEGKRKYAGPGNINAKLLDVLTELSRKLDTVDVTEQTNIRVNNEGTNGKLQQLNFQRSVAGGRYATQEPLTKLNDLIDDAVAQRLPPDVVLSLRRQIAPLTISQNYQQGRLTEDQYYGQVLGDRAKNRQVDALINARAVRNVLGTSGPAGASSLSGAEVQQALLGEAQVKGQSGQAGASFTGGLDSVFKGLKQDMNDLSQLGARVGQSLQQNLGNAFGDFITGAKSGKDAFKSFVTSVLADAARAFASQAVVALLGSLFGSYFGGAVSGGSGFTGSNLGNTDLPVSSNIGATAANGGVIRRFAAGGTVPALLTGGEFVFSASAAQRIGYGPLKAVNNGSTYDTGGMVRGGSGLRDDVPANLDPGSFVIKRSMVQKYGVNYLNALAGGGRVQKRAFGGSIMPNALASAGANYGLGASTAYPSSTSGYRRFAEGGATATVAATPQGSDNIVVPTPVYTTPTRGGSSGMGSVNVGVTVNNNGDSNSSSQSSNGGGVKDRQFADTLAVRVKAITLQTIIEHQRVGGILRPQSQLRPA